TSTSATCARSWSRSRASRGTSRRSAASATASPTRFLTVPSVAAIIFPFRRLAIWLSVLVLVVATLAVAITSLLVVPSLQGNLVNARVAEIDRSAKANINLFGETSAENAVNIYEQATGNRAAVLVTLNDRGDFLQVAGNVPEATSDPLAHEARTKGILSRAV